MFAQYTPYEKLLWHHGYFIPKGQVERVYYYKALVSSFIYKRNEYTLTLFKYPKNFAVVITYINVITKEKTISKHSNLEHMLLNEDRYRKEIQECMFCIWLGAKEILDDSHLLETYTQVLK